MKNIKSLVPGIGAALSISIVAWFLGKMMPIIGGPVFGILLGLLINNFFGKPEVCIKGITFTSKKILQWAIIVLGASLSISQIYRTGLDSIYVMLITLGAAFLSAYLFGKLMKVPFNLKTLIGVGTAICGGSAIAAVSPIIEAEDMEVAYSISTIFLFNIIAVLIFPILGHLMGFSDHAFGIWAGTAINDTSSVVAAGYAYSNAAGEYATIVKLTRTTMIIPIAMVYSVFMVLMNRKQEGKRSIIHTVKRIFPWFILWFLAASLLNSLGLFNLISNSKLYRSILAGGLISHDLIYYISFLGKFMIVMALSAVGLSADFKKMLKTGIRPMMLGLIVWFTVAVTSILVQVISGMI